MSRHVNNREEYESGSKWFNDWHRAQDDDKAKAIDVDLVGYCNVCLDPLYLIEATRNLGHKPTRVIERIARSLPGCRVLLVRCSGVEPGQICLEDRTAGQKVQYGYLTEDAMWGFLQGIRLSHSCAPQPSRPPPAPPPGIPQHSLTGRTP